MTRHHLAQRGPLEVVHDHEPRVAVADRAEIVHGDNVAVFQRCRGAGFIDESANDVLVLRPLGSQHFERALLLEHDAT